MFDRDITGRHKTEIDTPALLLDMDAVDRNIAKMAEFFSDKNCNLRPHLKTHKLPLIAHKQIQAGAIGVTCAKLCEAEVFMQDGIKNILIANEIVSDHKIQRMVELSKRGDLIVCVDNFENAQCISETAEKTGVKMNVLAEVNVGANRCGLRPGKTVLEFVQRISALEGIMFRGIMGYEGGLFINNPQEKKQKCDKSNELLVSTRNLLEENGIGVEIVSAGGSNTFYLTGVYPGITEIQVGSYVTMDSHNKEYGLDFEQAVTILATVISRPEKTRAVIDVGLKSISSDFGLPSLNVKGISLFKLNEEHGHVKIENPENDLSIGDKLELTPSHGCTTIPLHDRYIITHNCIVKSVEQINAIHGF